MEKATLTTVGEILSFKSDLVVLERKIKNHEIDWDALVKVGSKHLVLPAIYSQLQQKKLLQFIPKDLAIFLEEIATINRNRNLTLLKQITWLSQLFKNNNIDHVFLKGSALLAANYYVDPCERMIGDIDVLVCENQLEQAYKLLMAKGYNPGKTTFGSVITGPKHKHLTRLIKATELAAVEIHRKVLKKPYFDYLQPSILLQKKRFVNNIPVLCETHLLEHNILNLQINDGANFRKYLHFRTAYDTIVLLNKNPIINLKKAYPKSYFQNYFVIYALYFNDFELKKPSFQSKVHLQLYKFKTRSHSNEKNWNIVVFYYYLFSKLINRSWYFMTKKEYRNGVIKYRKRIINDLKTSLLKAKK
ncbi:nucleotidyltransferase family protein [Lutibacter holmesii]|uniref:Nucleotidyltransferase family protein n=1 Tax=Lutibacter holmesii TaxID=1137985 RepID=A0ABW3WMA1_9FLAO